MTPTWPSSDDMGKQYIKLCETLRNNKHQSWYRTLKLQVVRLMNDDNVEVVLPLKKRQRMELVAGSKCSTHIGPAFTVDCNKFKSLNSDGDIPLCVGHRGHLVRLGKHAKHLENIPVQIVGIVQELNFDAVCAAMEVMPAFKDPGTWHARRLFHRLRRLGMSEAIVESLASSFTALQASSDMKALDMVPQRLKLVRCCLSGTGGDDEFMAAMATRLALNPTLASDRPRPDRNKRKRDLLSSSVVEKELAVRTASFVNACPDLSQQLKGPQPQRTLDFHRKRLNKKKVRRIISQIGIVAQKRQRHIDALNASFHKVHVKELQTKWRKSCATNIARPKTEGQLNKKKRASGYFNRKQSPKFKAKLARAAKAKNNAQSGSGSRCSMHGKPMEAKARLDKQQAAIAQAASASTATKPATDLSSQAWPPKEHATDRRVNATTNKSSSSSSRSCVKESDGLNQAQAVAVPSAKTRRPKLSSHGIDHVKAVLEDLSHHNYYTELVSRNQFQLYWPMPGYEGGITMKTGR